jgi:hypothetical protein
MVLLFHFITTDHPTSNFQSPIRLPVNECPFTRGKKGKFARKANFKVLVTGQCLQVWKHQNRLKIYTFDFCAFKA